MSHLFYGLALLAGIIATAAYWSGDGSTAEREHRSKTWITAFIALLVLGSVTEMIEWLA
jgi:hypothetical protein